MTEISEHTITARIAEVSVPSRMGVKNTLAPITALLDHLEHPERKYPTVHVGGTSGKGSTATLIASILARAGYRVGLYTKPHLNSVRERFVIDGAPISPADMLDLIERTGHYEAEKPTWFELMTALAFQYFYEQQVDLGVIEVGLGGSYDATNVLLPEVSVLTNVGLDHTEILGDTVEKIAADKAGIIKSGRPVVTGVTQPSVIEIIQQRCRETSSPLKILGRDFSCRNIELSTHGSRFDFHSGQGAERDLSLTALGHHQVTNAGLALAATQVLRGKGYSVPEPAVRGALAQTRVPGRMELAGEHPTLLLDCAHSQPKMAALAEALRALFPGRRIAGVLAFSQGHDAAATLTELAPLLSSAVLTSFNAFSDYGERRSQPPEALLALLAERFPSVERHVDLDAARAVELARSLAGPDGLVCVTGSLFLVGQVRPVLLPGA